MVEFAIVLPLFCMILLGFVEFGLALNDLNGLRQGVRDSARQGAVLNFGSTNTCGLNGTYATASYDMQRLMCLTKNQVGSGNDVRVKIKFMNTGLSADSTTFASGNALVVCAIQPVDSRSNLFDPFLNSKYLKAKNVFRIEQDPAATEVAGQEIDPSGANWSWCSL